MATDLPPSRKPLFIDLTGLPDAVVREVTRLVDEARKEQAAPPHSGASPVFVSRPRLSDEDARRLLDRMASRSSGQALPADWSRADLYDDHD